MYSSALSSELAASPSSHSAAALGLLIDSEEVTIEAAVSQGPTPQGKTYTVTDSTKGYILELDGTPTAELLPELAQLAKRHGDGSLFVGIAVDGSSKDAREAKACSSSAGGEPRPLGEDSHGSNYIVRPVVAADRGVMHPKGFLLLGGVPAELVLPGATLRFHFFEKDSCEAHFQRVLAASSLANASTNSTNSTNSSSTSGAKKSARGAETASGEDGSQSQSQSQSFNGHRNGHSSKGTHAALVFSCLGRGESLYGREDVESAHLQRAAGANGVDGGEEPIFPFPTAGLFAGGEIGPVGARTYLHSFTTSLALFRDREAAPH
jgi:hypothetical protein